jgi:gliding motility-associated-like protein
MRYPAILLFIFIATLLRAQTIQLPLDQKRFTAISSIAEDQKDSFLYSSTVIPANFFGAGLLSNITKISLSKKVLWSYDYQFPKRTIMSKLTNYKDGFLWAGFSADINQNKTLVRINNQGVVIWSKRYGGLNDIDTSNSGKSEALVIDDGNIILAGGASTFAITNKANDLFLAKIDSNGNQIWAKNYIFSTLSNTYTNFNSCITTIDKGFLLCGTIYTLFDKSILLMKVDATGNVTWTKSYTNQNNAAISDEFGVQVIEMKDGNFALFANQKNILENSGNIIATISPFGNVSNPKLVSINPDKQFTMQANKVIYDANDDSYVVSAGVIQDSFPNLSVEQNLMYKINIDGKIDWKYNYYDELVIGFLTPFSDLIRTQNGGFAHLTAFSLSTDNLYPILILTDDKGSTGCQKPIDLVVDKNIYLQSTTFNIQSKTASPTVNFPVTRVAFKYEPEFPSIDLGKDTLACLIDKNILLKANGFKIDSYEWSTGATAASIEVNQLGKYSVIATNSIYCLTLYDTVIIAKSDKCVDFKFDIANAFTPNNDGVNDTFGPFGEGFTVTSFQVYNRWGQLVFEGNNTNRSWNGIANGTEASSDVYVYNLKYEVDKTIKIRSGEVTLIR